MQFAGLAKFAFHLRANAKIGLIPVSHRHQLGRPLDASFPHCGRIERVSRDHLCTQVPQLTKILVSLIDFDHHHATA